VRVKKSDLLNWIDQNYFQMNLFDDRFGHPDNLPIAVAKPQRFATHCRRYYLACFGPAFSNS
jgi:hypothetical protein